MLDTIIYYYFVIHIPITIFIDSSIIIPYNYQLSFTREILKFHINLNNDFLLDYSPNWFKIFGTFELFGQLPLFIYFIYNYRKQDINYLLWLLIYGFEASFTTFVCLIWIYLEHENYYTTYNQAINLILIYCPYLIIPSLIMIQSIYKIKKLTKKVKKPLYKLIKRIKYEQNINSGPLLKCIDLLIGKHESFLIEKFNLTVSDKYLLKQQIWDNLKKTKHDKDLNKRRRLMSKNQGYLYTPEYNNFIKNLYPLKVNHLINFDLNFHKYNNVKHVNLFKSFRELPLKPVSTYLEFEIFNEFTTKYFQGFNKIKIDKSMVRYKLSQGQNITSYIKSKLNKRNEFYKSCVYIINDLKNSNLEITQDEQLKLIYMNYFKDRQDLIELFPNDIPYPIFNYKNYQEIMSHFGERNDLLGILLFLATRHDKIDIIKDILKKTNMNIIESTNGDCLLTDMSLNHLIYYFTYYINRENYNLYLSNTINYITDNLILTNQIIDTIIKALLDLKLYNHAEILFQESFGNEKDIISYLNIYKRLKILTRDDEIIFKLSPSITTFENFIVAYSEIGNFDKSFHFFQIMTEYNFQTNLKIYDTIITGFINCESWEFENLSMIINKMVQDIDKQELEIDEGDVDDLINVTDSLINKTFLALDLRVTDFEQARKLRELKVKFDQFKSKHEYNFDQMNYLNKGILDDIIKII
ncbi:unnamed protein product [Candida verbasci]|uniref:EXPERA domain-containing protein n=1 Tax=Candida verbasci TaxID=1227364 RepID=A0A9W4TTN3_9ASCO|nr:unnamed protein product [Candida verbasci]